MFARRFNQVRTLISQSIKNNENINTNFYILPNLPVNQYNNKYKFIPEIYYHNPNHSKPVGLLLNRQIRNTDEIIYYSVKEIAHYEKRMTTIYSQEFTERFKQAMMQLAICPLTSQAKYNIIGHKDGSQFFKLVVFENLHRDAEKSNIEILYDLHYTIDKLV